MSLLLKRLVITGLGLFGALMVWPFLLFIQSAQSAFPGYLSFSVVQGAFLGLVFGALFGSIEGIVVSSRTKAFKGILFGMILGIGFGVLGVVLGQTFLFYAAGLIVEVEGLTRLILVAFANGASWVIIGMCLSMIEGLRSLSLRRILVGLWGGMIGGLIGGFALQLVLAYKPGNGIALLVGLSLFGLSLTFFYSLFEQGFSLGSIKLLNGPLRNKEYSITRNRMSVGTKDSCDIVLTGYRDIKDVHAFLITKKGRVSLVAAQEGNPVKVNDENRSECSLRREDVFAIGNAKFMYGFFSMGV